MAGEHAEVAHAPEWLIGLAAASKTAEKTQPRLLSQVADVHEGERNSKLFHLACALRGKGMSLDAVVMNLRDFNAMKCKPPLSDAEIVDIASRAASYQPNSPTKSRSRRSMPLRWFQLSTLEVFGDANIATLPDYQFGWYIRLMAHAWQNGGYLPNDVSKLWKLVGTSSRRKFETEMHAVLFDYEAVDVEGKAMFRNQKLTEMHADAAEKWLQRKQAGDAKRDKFRQQSHPEEPTKAEEAVIELLM